MNNLDLMKKRLNYEGGTQEQRMIKSKYKTFQKALLYSYQAAQVQKVDEDISRKALINPDKNSTSYDDKILSISYDYNYKPGDIFKWVGTNSYWLIYLPELTEDAYFRSQIRRCKYELFWIDMDQPVDQRKCSSYAYIRGPIETKIDSISKNNLILETPDYSLEIYLPKTAATKKYFKRYQRFAFNKTVWEIQVVDDISIEGVLQIIAEEHYINNQLDDVENEKITDSIIIKPMNPNNKDENIIGDTFIKPLGKFDYKLTEGIPTDGEWKILEKNCPVKISKNENGISLQWYIAKSGQFTLTYSIGEQEYTKIIVVESLF